jgi:hypothetical protein
MKINEEDRKDILSKYADDTSNELLIFLRRNYPVTIINVDWMIGDNTNKIYMIFVDDKQYHLKGNKKFLVGKIDSDLPERWDSLDKKIRRRTIKKYIDGVSNQFDNSDLKQ